MDQVNATTAQYRIASSINDVSSILQLPVEYILKVQADLIRDNVVTSCMKNIEDDSTFAFIFRITFLQVSFIYDILDAFFFICLLSII